VEELFDSIYAEPPGNQVRGLWRAAYGEEYPEELATLSMVTRSELRQLIDGARVGADGTIVDLGCGRGGPGIALALASGALLTGIDYSRRALDQARAAAARAGIASRARFLHADVQRTGLAAGSADVVISVDVVQLVQDRRQTFAEVARILVPGGRFCFTTWDVTPGKQLVDGVEELSDQRPLLAAAGFEIIRYSEPRGWRDRQAALYARAIASEADLTELAARALVEEAHHLAPLIGNLHRVLCIAERRA